MRFTQPLIEATLLRRDRFVADVRLETGEEISVHCANPGSMLGCSEPGSKVLISKLDNPKRKFKHQLEIIYNGRTPIGIHTGRPGSLIAEAITNAQLPQLAGYATLRRDVTSNRQTRIDMLLEGNGLRPCYVVVNNVTLADGRVALYPDSQSERDLRAMQDLVNLVREGNRAMAIFVAQRTDVEQLKPADHLDAEFGVALRDASARGVEIACYRARVTRRGIELDKPLPVDLSEP